MKSEKFRATTDLVNWTAGSFDYELILEGISDNEIEILCDWLADNCTDNFIFLKESSELIAGGSTNNKLRWERRKLNGRDPFDHITVDAHIRLDRDDIAAFRLTWIL